MIPPQGNADFAAAMERVLDVYRRPYDAAFPVVCMDETPRQLLSETREPIPAAPGRPAREDYEYRRCGSCNVFMATEPLAGRRMTKVTARRTKTDWAHFLNDIAGRHPGAKTITLVMDNLNTHRPGALYEAFPPAEAKALWDRFEFIYTPKHGSWLNVAEVELSVMIRQCLNRRIASIKVLRDEVAAWQASRDRIQAKVNWQFTTDDARVISNAFIRHLMNDRTLGARVVSEGFNLAVIEATSPGELLFRERVNGAWLASPIQVYLDLLRSEGRAKEMADHLRRERIGF